MFSFEFCASHIFLAFSLVLDAAGFFGVVPVTQPVACYSSFLRAAKSFRSVSARCHLWKVHISSDLWSGLQIVYLAIWPCVSCAYIGWSIYRAFFWRNAIFLPALVATSPGSFFARIWSISFGSKAWVVLLGSGVLYLCVCNLPPVVLFSGRSSVLVRGW